MWHIHLCEWIVVLLWFRKCSVTGPGNGNPPAANTCFSWFVCPEAGLVKSEVTSLMIIKDRWRLFKSLRSTWLYMLKACLSFQSTVYQYLFPICEAAESDIAAHDDCLLMKSINKELGWRAEEPRGSGLQSRGVCFWDREAKPSIYSTFHCQMENGLNEGLPSLRGRSPLHTLCMKHRMFGVCLSNRSWLFFTSGWCFMDTLTEDNDYHSCDTVIFLTGGGISSWSTQPEPEWGF